MSSMQPPLISIILPVYNRTGYLGQAIDSVLAQTYSNWELLIADDASDEDTVKFLDQYRSIQNFKIQANPQNLGLFANLNIAIQRSQGTYILLLCSDDALLPECLETSLSLLSSNPTAKLLLSAFREIDADGNALESSSIYYYNYFTSQQQELLQPKQVLPLILQYGSINGNLTGMFFHRSLFEQVGRFKEDCQQIGDWEWVYRVAREYPILMSKTVVASIRSHPQQLSAVNFKALRNSLEVIEMVNILIHDPYLAQLDSTLRWARHNMQFQLWYALKFALHGCIADALSLVNAIGKVTGFWQTLWVMICWLPKRWQVHQEKIFSLPPT